MQSLAAFSPHNIRS